MTGEEMAFRTVFVFAIIIFCITLIGIFLVLIKILLLFASPITIMGITMSQ